MIPNSAVKIFMTLASQPVRENISSGDEAERLLGAQLLLSEVLEYVVHGLGVIPQFNGTPISAPDGLTYKSGGAGADHEQMLDGLCDVAYTMHWNALAFGVPLEQGFALVCENNLTKFVRLEGDSWKEGVLPPGEWGCRQNVSWPKEVASVEVKRVEGVYYGVGKDARGKVRKPCHFKPVELAQLIESR